MEQGNDANYATIDATQAPPRSSAVNGDRADGEEKAPEKPLNLQTTAAINWVDAVLRLKDKYDTFFTQAFQSDQGLHKRV